MEELQSTEILDREILEDARKKASRILKTADDTVKSKAAEWEKKTASAVGEMEQRFSQQARGAVDEIMAVLPIDKRRAKAKKVEELLKTAVEGWYSRLSRQQVLALLRQELAKRVADYSESTGPDALGEIRATIHKISRDEAQAILQAVLPGRPCAVEEARSAAAYPELVLETREARIHASIGKAVDFYLGEQRAELLEALLGKAEIAGEVV